MQHQPDSPSWAILGGGLLGLTLAHRLAQAGQRVTVFEAAGEIGGLASAWNINGITWDRHYHVTLLSDAHTRDLLAELGLDEHMRWVGTRTGFYMDGRLHSMSNALEFLRFKPLSLVDKVRLAGTISYAARIRDAERLEEISVADWLTRISGKRVFERMWLPLLRSKLGESYQQASAAFIWATIARLHAARRSGLKREMFGYLPGGYGRMLSAMGQRLQAEGVQIELNAPVKRVLPAECGISVAVAGRVPQRFDHAVLTMPAPLAPAVCPALSEHEQSLLHGVQYQGIVCASVLLKRPLAGFYVTNLIDDWVPFTGVIEMTALVDPAELGGHHLVYLPKYVGPDDPLFEQSDTLIRDRFVGALQRMYPGLTEQDVVAFQVSRVRRVFPIPTLNYTAKLPPMRTSVPGVHLVNSAHIVNGTLNVNETVQLANSAARELLQERHSAPPTPSRAASGSRGSTRSREPRVPLAATN